MTEREALKLALDAFGEIAWSNETQWQRDRAKEAITVIKEALAQPEQEPVAWMDDYNACKCPDNEARCFSDKVFRMMQKHTDSLVKRQEPVAKVCHDLDGHIGWNPDLKQLPNEGTPLYTSPPQRKPEQEPVTWRYKIVDVFGRPAWTLKTPKSDTRVLESQPLYTTPPQRTWVGLTDEEVDECYYWKDRLWTTDELVRHVEAKLKEKNT